LTMIEAYRVALTGGRAQSWPATGRLARRDQTSSTGATKLGQNGVHLAGFVTGAWLGAPFESLVALVPLALLGP